MTNWYLSLTVHTADQPHWSSGHKWAAYIKDVDERVQPGDVVLIGNQGNGIFAWGTVLSKVKVKETEDRECFVEFSRGNIRYSLISAEVIAEIEDLWQLVNSPKRPFTFLTKQQMRAATSLLPTPKPPEPIGNSFLSNSQVVLDEDLYVEYKNVAITQIEKEAYEFAVAYASGEGGHTYFGVSDDGLVVGLSLDFGQRNDLRKRIEDRLFTIKPPLLAVSDYTLNFESVLDAEGSPIKDKYVIDFEVKPTGKDHETAGGRFFHKGYSGRRRLKKHER